ncbi:hypothetical protein HPB50_013091 [Hyalomma asiaticum]|uniref:Uncharacterized protein n=1 Tax=Hyalomma asiaticum TaxID=266040 RepID=A0ACB7SQN0_HYAAI|nr:hypothetical protein HPB50_013091 [Hyalomma asiaticum]
MDVAAFYGTADFTNHARQRIRLDDESAERMLTRIADGNTSDIDLSDDDEEEMRPSQHAAATDTDGGVGPSGAAQNLLPSQDQDDQHEVVGQQKRPLLWVTSEFEPPDTTFCPEVRDVSAMREPWLPAQVGEIKDSIQLLSQKYDDILSRQVKQEKDISSLNRRVGKLEVDCTSADIQQLKATVNDLEFRSRRLNIEVHGIQATPNEDLLNSTKVPWLMASSMKGVSRWRAVFALDTGLSCSLLHAERTPVVPTKGQEQRQAVRQQAGQHLEG